MKLKVDKKELVSLLSRTQNIVEKRNTMPILVNVLLEAIDDQLKVYLHFKKGLTGSKIPKQNGVQELQVSCFLQSSNFKSFFQHSSQLLN